MSPELSLENLRACQLVGDPVATINHANDLIREHPSSAATYMIKGDSERILGDIESSHNSYSAALQIYRGRFGVKDDLLPNDIVVAESKLLPLDIVNGNYIDARTRMLRLVRSGNAKLRDLLDEDPEVIKYTALEFFHKGDYSAAHSLASSALAITGKKDQSLELVLANSLINEPFGDTASLVCSSIISNRLVRDYPNSTYSWSMLGLSSQLLLGDRGYDELKSYKPGVYPDLSDLAIMAMYRKALELDEANLVARSRYHELSGFDYFAKKEGVLGANYSLSENVPISPTIMRNPEKNFSSINQERIEFERYWGSHKRDYQHLVDSIDMGIGHEMDPNCRVCVCIPAFMEEGNIYRTLVEYTKQKDVFPEEFEIIVLENHKQGYSRDGTYREVQRFKELFPEIRVHPVYHVFPEDASAMGNIRKLSFDLSLRRAMKVRRNNTLIMASNDADSYGMKPRALRWLIDKFDAEPELDLVAGKWDYPKELLDSMPTLKQLIRFTRIYQRVQSRYYGYSKVVSSGACSYFRAGTYAAIGGYEYTIKRGSDTELGLRISTLRKSKQTKRVQVSNALRIYTDPRRSLSKMVKGKSWVDQWEDTDWQEDFAVAGKSFEAFNDPTLETMDLNRLEWEINRFLEKTLVSIFANPTNRSSQRAQYIIDRTMRIMGITGSLNVDGSIVPRRYNSSYKKGSGYLQIDSVL